MSPISRTNQVLFFADACLKQAQQSTAQAKRQQEEAALSHLYAGVTSFANELVSQYRLPPFNDLSGLFARDDLPAELKELSLLAQQSDSWLVALLAQYQRMLMVGLGDAVVTSAPVQLITTQSDYVDLLRNWLIELEKTIQRMRLHYQEN